MYGTVWCAPLNLPSLGNFVEGVLVAVQTEEAIRTRKTTVAHHYSALPRVHTPRYPCLPIDDEDGGSWLLLSSTQSDVNPVSNSHSRIGRGALVTTLSSTVPPVFLYRARWIGSSLEFCGFNTVSIPSSFQVESCLGCCCSSGKEELLPALYVGRVTFAPPF